MEVSHVPRAKNKYADAPATIASKKGIMESVRITIAERKSSLDTCEEEDFRIWQWQDWRMLIMEQLLKATNQLPKGGRAPTGNQGSRSNKKKAEVYSLQEDKLFKKTITSDMLVCVNEDEQQKVMVEVQGGVYDGHQGGRSLWEELSRLAIFCRRCGKTLLNS
ncbi:hypothetical protein SESBI_05654 [Sesbania bispinosa]|nr:hypothetical protein SESBI_05654 [Sesbania bispinosa]